MILGRSQVTKVAAQIKTGKIKLLNYIANLQQIRMN
jgi:hypothetical protein